MMTAMAIHLMFGKGKDGVEEEWHPTSVTLLPVQVSSLAVTFPRDHYGLWEQLIVTIDIIIWRWWRAHRD